MTRRVLLCLARRAAACRMRRSFDDAAEPLRHLRAGRVCFPMAPRRSLCRRVSWRKAISTAPSRLAKPPAVDAQLLARGQERYDIYCSPCHGLSGNGDGMIVQRGFPAPPSYHTARLRAAPAQHFFDVITNGYGVMYSYASRVEPRDRWAIVAYVRALQESQSAKLADMPELRSKLP